MVTLQTDVQAQIAYVKGIAIPELAERLPCESWHKGTFQFENGLWLFRFECNHASGRFSASASGQIPFDAFALAKQMVLTQVSAWHKTRFLGLSAEEPALADTDAPTARVLIVDDDIDLALALQTAFKQMGYQTEVATRHEDLHRKIAVGDADYIFLDWKLNNEVTAGQVMEKAVRLIDAFGDLREKFSVIRPRVITYSVLDRDQVTLPIAGARYFTHLDHWQKPMPFHEVVERASGLLAVN